jgi:hypothetical protein
MKRPPQILAALLGGCAKITTDMPASNDRSEVGRLKFALLKNLTD